MAGCIEYETTVFESSFSAGFMASFMVDFMAAFKLFGFMASFISTWWKCLMCTISAWCMACFCAHCLSLIGASFVS